MGTNRDHQELFVKAERVMSDLQISKPLAYRFIREWNEELRAMGYTVINGRVPLAYYEEKIYGMSKE
ncbi:MAG: DNA-binding protein [Lachnospiraceae bacterium]